MLSKNIHLLFILLFSSVFSALSIAQIDTAKNSAQVVSYWVLHEKQTYSITYSQQEIVGTDTLKNIDLSYDVAIEVIDSTATSFTIKWTYANVTSAIESDASMLIADFLRQQEIQFTVNEVGVFKKIETPKQFAQNLATFSAKLPEAMREDTDQMCLFTNYFAEKQGIGIQELQAIHQFHNFHGLEYSLNEKLTGNLKEAETVNGSVVPGTIQVELEQLYPERKTFVVRSIKTLAPLPFEAALTATKPVKNTFAYSNQTTTLSVLHVSGWVILSNQLKAVQLPSKLILEERVIRMQE